MATENSQSRRTVSGTVGRFQTLRMPNGGWPAGPAGADGPDGPAAGPAARAFLNTADQLFASPLVPTRVAFNAETYDAGAGFDTGTGAYTVPAAGLYRLSATVGVDNLDIATDFSLTLRVDGTTVAVTREHLWFESAGDVQTVAVSTMLQLTAGQVVDVAAYRPTSAVQFEVVNGETRSYFEVTQIGQAFPLP